MPGKKTRFEAWFLWILILLAMTAFAVIFLWLDSGMIKIGWAKGSFPLDSTSTQLYNKENSGSFNLKNLSLLPLLVKRPISFLSGLSASTELLSETPLMVVVENHSAARPQQKGIAEADIVYETVAEGGITRFLLVFGKKADIEVGPVRSARPYFVDWAEEYGGAFVHVGGSEEALEKLGKSTRLMNLDEQLDNEVIQRNKTYAAPHNAFTNLQRILNQLTELGWRSPLAMERFIFQKSPESKELQVKTITFDFSTAPYKVEYTYDPPTNTYERSVWGIKEKTLHPANIVVQFTRQQVVDEQLHVAIKTHGSGKALVFRNGEVLVGTWEKGDTGFTQFFDHNHNPVSLNPGQTWIEVVSDAMGVNYF